MRVTPYPVTAYGLACGLGRDTASVLAQLRRGERGLSPVPLDVPFMTVTGTIPGELPELDSRIAEHDSRLARVTQLGFESIASEVARAVSQWGPSRVACVLGTSTGGIRATELAHAAHHHEGTLPASFDYRTQHPFHITTDICRKLGGFSGPAYIVSTACSSSGKVFASARRLLDAGLADAVLVGGADALCHTTVRGFFSLGVMAEGPCMPFSADRPGMNIGEGAAFALVERSGTPRAMLLGVGESSDAFHPSSPHPEGRGALAAMAHALEQAGLTATDVDYVNAHGTGTKHNDSAESQAVETLLGREVPVVSTKGYTGHTLGACGAVEAIFGIVSIEEGFLPASVGSTPRDPEITIHVPSERLDLQPRYVLSNSFAFGGNNCSVLLGEARVTAVHVLGRGFFTPSFPNLAAFRAGVPDAEAQRPAVDFVQSRNKRGCSILTLAAAEVAHQACLDAGLSPAQPALVFGSCHGEMEIAVAQMEMFQEDKGLLSPARFKNSVHNTGAGMFSIAMDNRGYATAIAGGHDTVALSLLEAILLLQHDRYETAVVALADERLPAPLTHFSPHEALGVAVVLGRAPHPERGSLGTLSIPQRSPEALFAADTRFSGNPIAPLLDVIDALDSGRAGRVPLSLPGGEPWWCEVQSNAEARART